MSALALRIFACVCMLLDHIGYCFPQLYYLRYVGRLAFPLFVFLIVNGYAHTSSRLRYALRLALFAVISQVPFTLFCGYGSFLHKGNVFFTLLCALLVLWATDGMLKNKVLRWVCFLPSLAAVVLFHFGILSSDYGLKGILLALTFRYLYRSKLLTVLGTFVSVFFPQLVGYGLQCYHLLQGREEIFQPPTDWALTQAFSLLALIPIFLYNGKRGRMPENKFAAKAVQWGFYLFYPLHMLLLYLLP